MTIHCLIRLSSLALLCFASGLATNANASNVTISAAPLSFEPNQGQAPAGVRYLVRNGQTEALFLKTGIHLVLPQSESSAMDLGIEFVGANPEPAITGLNSLPGRSNYLLGNDPSRWIHDLPTFSKVKYQTLYSGTDLVFYGNGQSLEHDFEVNAGADPSRIAFRIKGANSVDLSRAGDLNVHLPGGVLVLKEPRAYQDLATGRKEVSAHFLLAKDGTVTFKVGTFDTKVKLVIDPVLTYATYLDALTAPVTSIATDSAGDTYVTGYTSDGAYPVTNGVFQPTCVSCPNNTMMFVTKFDPTGRSQIYSTFLGGTTGNEPRSIAIDAGGNAIIGGYTSSADYPLKNPVSVVNTGNGSTAAFITSLTPDGSALNYSSVLGGNFTYGFAVAVDSQGNAYLAGDTNPSPGFPTTPGALNATSPSSLELGFVSKFSATGSLAYSALIGEADQQGGGAGITGPVSIAVDSQGSAYIAGGAGILWPVTSGVYSSKFPSGSTRAVFVTKLAPDASKLVYSTFIGPGEAISIALDQNNNAFIAGDPDATSYPVTTNAWNSGSAQGCCGAFFSEISPNGSKLLYSSFFPGLLYSMTLDSTGNIYLTGQVQPGNLPLKNPLISVGSISSLFPNQNASGFISEFDPTGTNLIFSTLFGDLSPGVYAIATDPAGHAHVAGSTVTGIYTTPGAFLGSVTPAPQYVEFTYGFTALIDTNKPAPSVCFNSGLYFNPVPLNTVQSQSLQVLNCGNAPLTIQSLVSSDPAFTIPVQSNQCSTSPLPPGGLCTFQISFAPTIAQTYSAVLTLASNASIPTTNLALVATGALPIASMAQALNFNPVLVGQTAPANFLILSNSGPVPLTIDLVHTTITGDFAILPSSDCTTTVPQYSSCAFVISFTPTTAGTRTGVLTVPTSDPIHPLLTSTFTGTGYSTYPAPTVTSIMNPTYPVGGGATNGGPVSLGVSGTNFFPTSVVTVDGEPQATTYVDNSYVTAILDPALLAIVGQLPVSVINPSPGGGVSASYPLTVYLSVPLSSSALVYEPVSGLLFAAIPASAINNANTIVPVDPLTGKTKNPISVLYDPNRLAVSPDGSKMYVASQSTAQIQRIDLATQQVEKTFNFPASPDSSAIYVTDMQVVPASPTSVIVTLADNGSAGDGVALYNATGLVNSAFDGVVQGTYSPGSITFASSPTTAYELPGSGQFLAEVQVTPTGVTYIASPSPAGSAATGSIVRSDGTFLYTNSGQVWDPSTQKLNGTYTTGTNLDPFSYYFVPSVVPDTSSRRTFFLDAFASYSQYQALAIEADSQVDYSQVGSIAFLTFPAQDAQDLVRWGIDGLAFRTYDTLFQNNHGSDQIVILRSTLAASTPTQTSTPTLTGIAPNQVATSNSGFTLQLTGKSFTPTSVAQVNGSPRETTYITSTTLSTFIPASDIATASTLKVTVVTPGPGGGTSGSVTLGVVNAGGVPAVALAPATLTFGPQALGSTSPAQVVTLQNSGNGPLLFATNGFTISGSASASFLESTNCGTSLAAAASCTISVSFTPTVAGAVTASLSIADNATPSPQTVGLSGAGTTLGLQFIPVTPCRVADTRNSTGAFGGPVLASGTTREFDIPQSSCGIPSSAVAYSLNVTVVPSGPLNYMTMWPSGLSQPYVSTLNSDGRVKANSAITPAGTNGGINIFVSDATQVILDIDGYFVQRGTASALAFYPVTPCRVSDTRNAVGALGGPFIAGNTHRDFPVQSSNCGVPSTAQAYSLNVTAVPHTTLNYLTAWPAGQAQPYVSTLNSPTGAVTANAALVPAASNGDVSIFVSDDTDVILDVNGYFAPATTGGLSLYTTTPCRVVDTRGGAGAFHGVLAVAVQTGVCAPPSSAQAYVLNATVVPSGPLNYLTLWPDRQSQPYVSTLNADDAAITSNMSVVPTTNGSVDVFASDPTNAILDISSYFAP